MIPASGLADLSSTRTLLVDRDADTRQMYAEFLKRGAYEIEEAEDGREALAKALTHPPDIIVTETRLPGITGFDLCRLLRQDSLTRQIPILVVTGDAFDSEIARARQAGADAVLVKPCLPERLAAELLRVLTMSRQTRQSAATHAGTPDLVTPFSELRRRLNGDERRAMLCRVHRRGETTTPPTPAPALVCPTCDQPLRYLSSFVGGVSALHPEQWDYYECSGGCGSFQYRQRTRKLRRAK